MRPGRHFVDDPRCAREDMTKPRETTTTRARASSSSRPAIALGRPVRAHVEPPPRTRAEARDGTRFPSEKLTRELVRRGYDEEKHREWRIARTVKTIDGKTTFDDGTFMSPRALQEMLTRMATSETLKAIRANANEGAKETRRVPKRGRRDDGSYDVELRGEALKTWSAPELVHARAEESAAFFRDLASDVGLHALERRVPHGVRKRNLFETLHGYNVPIHRAMWMVKVNYLSQCKRDFDACRRAWTEDLLAHIFDVLRDEEMVAQSGEGVETELKYVLALANYSVEEDLVDQQKYLHEFLRFMNEQKRQRTGSAHDFARALSPALRTLVPQASKSHADSVGLVDRVSWCLQEILKERGQSDKYLVISLSDVVASVAAANMDAFVAAPRDGGLNIITNLRRDFQRKKMPLSQRLCSVLDDVDNRVKSLAQAASPELITIKARNLIETLHKLLESNLDQVASRTIARKYIDREESEELAMKSMVKTSCDWCMDVSEDEAMKRRTAVRIFFVELAETSSRLNTYVFDWIKERTMIVAREDYTKCISELLIELLWGKVVDLSQLLNFIMVEGIVEHKDSGASQKSLAAFREYMSQIVRNNDERESKLDDSMVRTLKQLLESANEMSDATISRALTPPHSTADVSKHFEISTDEEKRLLELFHAVTYADLLSKLEELKCVHDEFKCSRDAHSVFSRVVVGALVLKPSRVRLLAELVGGIGDDVTTDVLSYVGGRVCDDANVDGVLQGAYWDDSNAARRWEIAQSLVEFRLCLLHNIVKRKRDAAMGIVKGAIQQLKELALSTRDVSHKLLLIWVQVLTLIPLIGYVLMSNELKDDFLQLIVEVLDSFIGKTIVEESEEDLVAESFAGESLVDRLIALFSVIWRSEVPQWLPAIPKLPFWDVSSKMVPMTEFIDSKTLAGVVCVRLKRAIGGPARGKLGDVNAWKTLASGASTLSARSKISEKAEFWLQGTVRRPGGNLAWENVSAEPNADHLK